MIIQRGRKKERERNGRERVGRHEEGGQNESWREDEDFFAFRTDESSQTH